MIKNRVKKTLSFAYKIKRSARVKRARIVVSANQIEVVAPLKMLQKHIDDFVILKQDWVKAAQDKIQKTQLKIEPLAPENYQDGVWIPFQGEKFQLTIHPSKRKRVRIEFCKGFIASIPNTIVDSNVSYEIQNELIRWMKKEAKKIAEFYVKHYEEQSFLTPRSIKIKNQKSRWGSCGIHNDINLNWLLLLAPPKVFEYVVVHELCHIRYKNHAAEFWALVESLMPDYKQHRLWLKRYGASLMMGL